MRRRRRRIDGWSRRCCPTSARFTGIPPVSTPSARRPGRPWKGRGRRSPRFWAPNRRRSSSRAAARRATTSRSRGWPMRTGRRATTSSPPPSNITPSWRPAVSWRRKGFRVTYLPVDGDGLVDPAARGRGDHGQDHPHLHHACQQRDRDDPAHRRDRQDRPGKGDLFSYGRRSDLRPSAVYGG